MLTTLTIQLPESEAQALERFCVDSGKTRNEVVRDSLRVYRLQQALRTSHAQLGPAACAIGWMSEDDILNEV